MHRAHNRVLVIAAHPDDEILGCGGTCALHTEAGDYVHVLVVCEGESLRYKGKNVDQHSQSSQAAAILGIEDITCLSFPDQRLDTYTLTEIISPLEKKIRAYQPNIIYCQYGGDINKDHALLFQAALVAARPTEKCIEAVYSFYTASSTEWAYPRSFIPDTWVDISPTLERKLMALSCYHSELRPYPHPRSLQSLKNQANFYGNQCCLDAAEVFMTIRRLRYAGQTPI